MGIVYKFVELSVVTDQTIEDNVNERVRDGWTFSGMHFAMNDSSRRPTMAFLCFVRDQDEDTVAPSSAATSTG